MCLFSGGGHAMSHMQGPCRERLVFPWTGVLLRDETIEKFPVKAGQHVTVEGKENGQFKVSVPREGATRYGMVPPGSVDEVLCAAIEAYLLNNQHIGWGSSGAWRNRGRARQAFNLRGDDEILKAGTVLQMPEEAYNPDADEWDVNLEILGPRRVPRSKVQLVTGEDGQPKRTRAPRDKFVFDGTLAEDHTIPGPTTAVSIGDEIQCTPSPSIPGGYLVSKLGESGDAEVQGTAVEMDFTLPPCTAPLELMCFEFAPYAAALAGLRPNFVAAARGRPSGTGGSEYWAGTLGATFGTRQILRDDLATLALQRGDLVAFFAEGDVSTHMAVATGDRQDVYSLWNRPQYYPVRAGLADLWDSEKAMPTVYAKTATPAWHT
jgi:hypothetical protein